MEMGTSRERGRERDSGNDVTTRVEMTGLTRSNSINARQKKDVQMHYSRNQLIGRRMFPNTDFTVQRKSMSFIIWSSLDTLKSYKSLPWFWSPLVSLEKSSIVSSFFGNRFVSLFLSSVHLGKDMFLASWYADRFTSSLEDALRCCAIALDVYLRHEILRSGRTVQSLAVTLYALS